MKNPLTQAGIEPATFRFVAQHLNHCTTAVPLHVNYGLYIGPGRTKIKLNKFQCRHTNAKFVPNPLNRFGDETYIRPLKIVILTDYTSTMGDKSEENLIYM